MDSENGSTGYSDNEFVLGSRDTEPITGNLRDTVEEIERGTDSPPPIVSVSDIHGYLQDGQSALLTLRDHPEYEPVVTEDSDGRLHWADNDYILIFNGDLIDRGPQNFETVQMVQRLIQEAPPGRVRVTLGNHEMGILTPSLFGWDRWYSGQVGIEGRTSLVSAILDGHVVAAYEGYNVTYVHAGAGKPYEVPKVNDELQEAATELHGNIGELNDAQLQRRIVNDHPLVLGMGNPHAKGRDAGLIWIDLKHLPEDAPPQVVGHTRHEAVRKKGSVICENVIRNNTQRQGGEAILLETPSKIEALSRSSDGGVQIDPFPSYPGD